MKKFFKSALSFILCISLIVPFFGSVFKAEKVYAYGETKLTDSDLTFQQNFSQLQMFPLTYSYSKTFSGDGDDLVEFIFDYYKFGTVILVQPTDGVYGSKNAPWDNVIGRSPNTPLHSTNTTNQYNYWTEGRDANGKDIIPTCYGGADATDTATSFSGDWHVAESFHGAGNFGDYDTGSPYSMDRSPLRGEMSIVGLNNASLIGALQIIPTAANKNASQNETMKFYALKNLKVTVLSSGAQNDLTASNGWTTNVAGTSTVATVGYQNPYMGYVTAAYLVKSGKLKIEDIYDANGLGGLRVRHNSLAMSYPSVTAISDKAKAITILGTTLGAIFDKTETASSLGTNAKNIIEEILAVWEEDTTPAPLLVSEVGSGSGSVPHKAYSQKGVYYTVDLSGCSTDLRVNSAELKIHIASVPVPANGESPYFRVYRTTGRVSNTASISENTAQKGAIIQNVYPTNSGYYTVDITSYLNDSIASGQGYMTILVDAWYGAVEFGVSTKQSQNPPVITATVSAAGFDDDFMFFKPADKYVSEQNPPDFTWQKLSGAVSYDLVISTDKNRQNIAYEKKNLTTAYYNFNQTFETGKEYYWSVKYNFGGGIGFYTKPRRFMISPDAQEFLVPDIDTLLSRIPSGHPRVFTTPSELSAFRDLRNTNSVAQYIGSVYISKGLSYAEADNLPARPEISSTYWDFSRDRYVEGKYEEYVVAMSATKAITDDFINQMFTAGFAYLITGNEDIGAFAKKALLEMSSWDITGSTSYPFQDQIHREIVYKGAMVYDWIYNLLSDTEKQTVRNMIKERITHRYNNGACMLDLLESIENWPGDSHGWSNIGFTAIAAYVLVDEVPEAREWLSDILPLYIAQMHPWSNQDGGWAQGTAYYTYSTIFSKDFIDILAAADVINLYDKAWGRNEAEWVLYAYPNGSKGSFGDGGGGSSLGMPGVRDAMTRLAYFGDNELARWIIKDMGNILVQPSSYYTSSIYDKTEDAPTDYPMAHNFTDIDWVVMNNSVTDPGRVQMTFKSSPYGSYNHSHGDQNSFIIQWGNNNSWLAGVSGYYDYYHSPHDLNITRQSFSHNTITVDGAQGQGIDSIDAKGNVPLFVNHRDFDSTTGEAHEAYNGLLDKFDRNIIYIRPDVFIVVDDLDAAGDNSSKFEWWFNAPNSIEYTNNSLISTSGDKKLKAEVKYPLTTTASYYGAYTSPLKGTTYTPTISEVEQKRVSFATEKLKETKMIVSMSLYETGGSAKSPTAEYFDSYVKLTYPDGTVVLVSLLDKTETVTAGDITFKGAAVTLSEKSIMLTNGTYLKKGDDVIVSSKDNISLALGYGEISLSCDSDTEITFGNDNEYLDIENASSLKDREGNTATYQRGVSAQVVNSGDVKFFINKGNYSLINTEVSVLSPDELSVENIALQKRGNSVAVFFDKENKRTYDIKIGGTIYEDISSPYIFAVSEGVNSVFVRENAENMKGNWSEPSYVSSMDSDITEKVTFSEALSGEKSFIKATTRLFPQTVTTDMYLAGYKSDTLNNVSKGEQNGAYKTALIENLGYNVVKAYLFGDSLKPLSAPAFYNTDSTELVGITVDGKALSGFENGKISYEIEVPYDKEYLPFIRAEVKDNSSTAQVIYDFENLKAKVIVTGAKGTKREIDITFKIAGAKIHVVEGATAGSQLTYDSATTSALNGSPSQMSTSNVATLKFKRETTSGTTDHSQSLKVYTNLKENEGGTLFGARLFSQGRDPISLNHMEVATLDSKYKGYDYFVFGHDDFYDLLRKTEHKGIKDAYLTFDIEEDAEILVCSMDKMPNLLSEGFTDIGKIMSGRYMHPLGPEDIYYNTTFNGCSASDVDSAMRLKYYSLIDGWIDVSPISKYVGANDTQTLNNYKNNNVSKDSFSVVSDNEPFVVSFDYPHTYKKTFKKGQVSVNLSDISGYDHRVLVIIKPTMPKAFFEE